jgi:tetratricopeptide (TPR) repeat protein
LATVQKFNVPLEEATTSSLEALQALSLAVKAYREKGPLAALPYDQRAIKLDPNFASGYRAVGDDYYSVGQIDRAREYLAKAFQLREHASAREKLKIAADYYLSTGELDKTAQTSQEIIENYPRAIGAYAGLGAAYSQQGQYEKAADITRQAVQLETDQLNNYENLAGYALALQHFDEAREVICEAESRGLDDDGLHQSLYALAFLGADSAAMAEQQQWFAGKPEFEQEGLALAADTRHMAVIFVKRRN